MQISRNIRLGKKVSLFLVLSSALWGLGILLFSLLYLRAELAVTTTSLARQSAQGLLQELQQGADIQALTEAGVASAKRRIQAHAERLEAEQRAQVEALALRVNLHLGGR